MIALGVASGPARRERRSAGYTSTLVGAAEAAAAGGAAVATATAAVETASSAWGRALALAIVEPRGPRTAALTPPFLEMVGRELGRRGELVCDIDATGGRVRLHPASSSYVVLGGHRPEDWVYTLTLFGPGTSTTVYRRREGVVHLAYGRSVERVWEGKAPWQSASLSGNLLTGVERQLSGEALGPSGYLLPTPDLGDQSRDPDASENDQAAADPLAELRADLAAAAGRTLLAPTQLSGHGAGPAVAPEHDYRSSRFGFNPPEAAIQARENIHRSIVACYGYSPAMVDSRAPGTSLREAWRQFVAGSVVPLAEIVSSQLSEALGTTIRLDMRRAGALDVATRARAWRGLVGQEATMEPAAARELVGL